MTPWGCEGTTGNAVTSTAEVHALERLATAARVRSDIVGEADAFAPEPKSSYPAFRQAKRR